MPFINFAPFIEFCPYEMALSLKSCYRFIAACQAINETHPAMPKAHKAFM
jgi:hypothetical protein